MDNLALRDKLFTQLTRDEGKSATVYTDSRGFQTIGIGRLVDARKPGSGLRDVEIAFMLQNDIEDRINALIAKLPWFGGLNDARKGALLNMAFQLGTEKLMTFVNMLAALRDERFHEAYSHAKESDWAKQTPERAERVARQLETGEWQ